MPLNGIKNNTSLNITADIHASVNHKRTRKTKIIGNCVRSTFWLCLIIKLNTSGVNRQYWILFLFYLFFVFFYIKIENIFFNTKKNWEKKPRLLQIDVQWKAHGIIFIINLHFTAFPFYFFYITISEYFSQ